MNEKAEPKPLTEEEFLLWRDYAKAERRGHIEPSGEDCPYTEDYLERFFATIRTLRVELKETDNSRNYWWERADYWLIDSCNHNSENHRLQAQVTELKDKLRIQVDESCFQNGRAEKAEAEAVEWQEHSRISIQQDGESIKRLGQEMDENERLREALRLAGIRLDKLVGRLRACHEETGNHELIEESESYATEAKAALAGEKTT